MLCCCFLPSILIHLSPSSSSSSELLPLSGDPSGINLGREGGRGGGEERISFSTDWERKEEEEEEEEDLAKKSRGSDKNWGVHTSLLLFRFAPPQKSFFLWWWWLSGG